MAMSVSHPLVGGPRSLPHVKVHFKAPARHISYASTTCSTTEVQEVDKTELPLEKQEWQSSVRRLQGRRKHRHWEPLLSTPPPLLEEVCVVLVSPKRPISVGTVARSCSCFECEDLRIVEPRCDHLARSSRNGSKGAQFLLWRAQQHDSLHSALADVEFSVACTRWVAGRPCAYRSIAELLATPQLTALMENSQLQSAATESATLHISTGMRGSSSSSCGSSSTSTSIGEGTDYEAVKHPDGQQNVRQRRPGRKKLALVFGREVSGLTAAELDMCDATLSIPIGRLQESMSLSHAVSVVLSRLFEERTIAASFPLPQGVADLAAGYQDSGVER